MANDFKYELSYASVPFLLDQSTVVRMTTEKQHMGGMIDPREVPPRKHQPEGKILEEIDRLQPFDDLDDFTINPNFPGRNLGAIARPWQRTSSAHSKHKVGQFYYPNTASRWSVFRGLATSTMAKEMVRATTGGLTTGTFVMKCMPIGQPQSATETNYTVSTSMYMLPPRCINEHGGGMDGLYLVTLVDERYKWQFRPSPKIEIDQTTTWANLLTTLASDLGITIVYTAIDGVYLQPEQDSQLWSDYENAAVLLDAVAFNLGRTFVRSLDGTYDLLTNAESLNRINTNKTELMLMGGGGTGYARTAGGDMLYSGNLPVAKGLPGNSLNDVKNAVCPATIDATFPKYVVDDDPTPHLINSRYPNHRPSCWYEEGFGTVHVISTPIRSGGPYVSGITGVNNCCIHDTAKALISGELQTTPLNVSGLTALAMQLSRDYWEQQAMTALDETYPGIYAWTPEGFNDIIWTYSATVRQATTRVQRAEWNFTIREYQHATPTISGQFTTARTNTPRGVGGLSVAQSWHDGFSGLISTTLAGSMTAAASTASFTSIANFPTQNRWRGSINSGSAVHEELLFEGTSGSTSVSVVLRGIDGTIPFAHAAGETIIQTHPDETYGVNYVKTEKMQFVYPHEWQSGGIQGIRFVPQTQSVFCYAGSGTSGNQIIHWSGRVNSYDATKNSGSEFPSQEYIWIVERNGFPLASGKRYDGQLVGYAPDPLTITPVYAVNQPDWSGVVNKPTTYDKTFYYSSGAGVVDQSGIYSGGYTSVFYHFHSPANWGLHDWGSVRVRSGGTLSILFEIGDTFLISGTATRFISGETSWPYSFSLDDSDFVSGDRQPSDINSGVLPIASIHMLMRSTVSGTPVGYDYRITYE